MPLPVIANVIRVSVEGHLANGHKFANVLHLRKDGALSNAAAIAIADPILAAHYTTAWTTGTTFKAEATAGAGVEQIRYTPLDGTTATTVISHVITGVNANDALPGDKCLVVTLRTGTRGRSFRGRVYTGPNNEGGNTATGQPLGALVTNVAKQWNDLLTHFVATGVSLVVASYKLATATDVASCTVDGRWDTQRRRLNT